MQTPRHAEAGPLPRPPLEPLLRRAAADRRSRAWAEAAPDSIVENLYGPTELTIACTLYRWDPERSPAEAELGLVPIGEPYPGMTTLVADGELREVADRAPTASCSMTGPQVTLGYWRDPEKTAAAFVVPPGREDDPLPHGRPRATSRRRRAARLPRTHRQPDQDRRTSRRARRGRSLAARRIGAGEAIAVALAAHRSGRRRHRRVPRAPSIDVAGDAGRDGEAPAGLHGARGRSSPCRPSR